jgi:DNA-binding CsgD family transcriptional regulator
MDGLSLRQDKDVARKKVFIVRLTETERSELETLVRKGKASALAITRARILLKADQGKDGEAATDAEVAEALSVAPKTVFNVRRRWVEHGLEAAIHRKKQAWASRSHKLDGRAEAQLVATCCGPAPQGRARWTLRMLAGKLVELQVVNSISPETVRSTLKKMQSSLG